MFNTAKRMTAGLFIAASLMAAVPSSLTGADAGQVQAANILSARVNAGVTWIRSGKSANSRALKQLHRNDFVKVLSTGSSWVRVRSGRTVGYARGKLLTTGLDATAADEGGVNKGQQVINFALKFVGNPYHWGGTSLTSGTDCSGFVMSVYKHFGVRLPRTSYTQRKVGKQVGSLRAARAGDIICYNGHVALYMGNGRIVHAKNRKSGIVVSNNAAYRHIVSIRRIY